MKKILSLLLVLSLVLGSFSFAFADSDDVTGHKNEDAIRRLMELELVEGDSQGIRPNDSITRAEFATFVIRALGRERVAEFATGSPFADVPESHWAAGAVKVSNTMGLVTGYGDGNFGPSDAITYEQALTLVVRALGYEAKAADRGGYPVGHLMVAEDLGLTSDVEGVAGIPAQRGDVFQMLDNALTVDMMEQVGFGDNKEYKVPEEDADTLLGNLGYDKVTERIVGINSSDNEITLAETEEVVVSEDFDFEANFGLRLTAWINGDDEVVIYNVVDAPVIDAIAWNADDEELTTVDADTDYDMAEDVTVYANGSEEDIADLDAAYDYAKLVLNADGEVIFVDAYNWDNSMVFDELDETDVIGYDVEAAEVIIDAEDYTIVRNGMAIELSDLEEGDIVYYNEDAQYAEVYNNSVSGVIDDVFVNEFDVDGDTYEYDYATYIEDGDDVEYIDALSEGVLESMEAAEFDVESFLTRDGYVRHVIGDLDQVETTSDIAYVVETGELNESRGTQYYYLDVVNAEGDFVKHDVTEADFVDVDEDDTTTDEIADISADDLVIISIDEDGDLSSIEKATNDTEAVSNFDISEETYLGGYKVSDSAVVFNTNLYDGTAADQGDIVVSEYSELDFDTIVSGTVYGNAYGKVAYVVIDETDEESNTEYAMVDNVRTLSNGYKKVYITVNGEEMIETFTAANATDAVEGKMIEINLDEDTFAIEGAYSSDVDGTLDNVVVRADKLVVDDATYYLSDNGYMFDVTGASPAATSLRDLEEGTTVELYYEGESQTIVEFVVVTADASEAGEEEEVETGVVTHINASENLILVDDEVLEMAKTVKLYDGNDEVAAIGKDAVVNYLAVEDKLEDIKTEDGLVVEISLEDVTEESIDKSALETKIAEANELGEADYTAETWTVFETALEEAKAVANNEEATQEEIDSSIAVLETAIDGLEEKPVATIPANVEEAKITSPSTGSYSGTVLLDAPVEDYDFEFVEDSTIEWSANSFDSNRADSTTVPGDAESSEGHDVKITEKANPDNFIIINLKFEE